MRSFWNLPICWNSSLHNIVPWLSFGMTRVINPVGTEESFCSNLRSGADKSPIFSYFLIWYFDFRIDLTN